MVSTDSGALKAIQYRSANTKADKRREENIRGKQQRKEGEEGADVEEESLDGGRELKGTGSQPLDSFLLCLNPEIKDL